MVAGRFERVGVIGEEHECGEPCRSDGIALGDGLGGVANRVKRVSDLSNMFGQIGHFGDSAGVVGDGAVSIQSDDDASHR